MVTIITTLIICITIIIVAKLGIKEPKKEQKLEDIEKIVDTFKKSYFTYNINDGRVVYIGSDSAIINVINNICKII